jgi:hypothetical protein
VVLVQGFVLCTYSHSTVPAKPPVHFGLVILEMDFWELFAPADLELCSSLSQTPKWLQLKA